MEYHFIAITMNKSHSRESTVLGEVSCEEPHIILQYVIQDLRPEQEWCSWGKHHLDSHSAVQISSWKSSPPESPRLYAIISRKISSVGLSRDVVTSSAWQTLGTATFMYPVQKSDLTESYKQKETPSPVASTKPEMKRHRIKYFRDA